MFLYDLSDTWNDSGTDFDGIKIDVDDIASAAASRLLAIEKGGVTKFVVNKDGEVGIGGWPSSMLDVMNGTSPASMLIYNTRTDFSNYERVVLGWNSNIFEIGLESSGTGTDRDIAILGKNVGIGSSSLEFGRSAWLGYSSGNGGYLRVKSDGSEPDSIIRAYGDTELEGGNLIVRGGYIATSSGQLIASSSDFDTHLRLTRSSYGTWTFAPSNDYSSYSSLDALRVLYSSSEKFAFVSDGTLVADGSIRGDNLVTTNFQRAGQKWIRLSSGSASSFNVDQAFVIDLGKVPGDFGADDNGILNFKISVTSYNATEIRNEIVISTRLRGDNIVHWGSLEVPVKYVTTPSGNAAIMLWDTSTTHRRTDLSIDISGGWVTNLSDYEDITLYRISDDTGYTTITTSQQRGLREQISNASQAFSGDYFLSGQVTIDGDVISKGNLIANNDTTPTELTLYNTYTDGSNYERAVLGWDSNVFKIRPEAAGTGSVRDTVFSAGSVGVNVTSPDAKLAVGFGDHETQAGCLHAVEAANPSERYSAFASSYWGLHRQSGSNIFLTIHTTAAGTGFGSDTRAGAIRISPDDTPLVEFKVNRQVTVGEFLNGAHIQIFPKISSNFGTALRIGPAGGSHDVALFRVDGGTGTSEQSGLTDSGAFGFSLVYMGTRTSNDNSLSLFSDNGQAVSQVEAVTVLQDGKVGILDTSPSFRLSVGGTDAIKLPSGTTAQRPSSPVNGLIRYNSSYETLEQYASGAWQPFDLLVENDVTGAYTLQLSDTRKVIAADANVTVPPNSSVAFPIGTVINIYRKSVSDVDILEGAGVTIRNRGKLAWQYVEIAIRKRDTDEWVLVGEVV